MIIVNVRVPAIERVYNFSLEEKAQVGDLIEELVELISQKEMVTFHGDQSEMVLCATESGEMCARERCLADYGVVSGSELILA